MGGCQRSQTLSSITHLCVSLRRWRNVCSIFPINHAHFRSWNSQSGAFFFFSLSGRGGENTFLCSCCLYISTQRGNGHENRLKPMCNGKFIPLWPWTHQTSREIHWRFFFKISRKLPVRPLWWCGWRDGSLIKLLCSVFEAGGWLSGDWKERFQTYRNENEAGESIIRGWGAGRLLWKQDKRTKTDANM